MASVFSRVVPGYQHSMVILAAARLRLVEALVEAPASAGEVARRLCLDPRGTVVLLDALAALGLFTKRQGRYRVTAVARRYLDPASPEYLGDLLRHQETSFRSWARLAERVAGKHPARPPRPGELEREFVLAMEANARRRGGRVAALVDLDGVERLLDVGGGPGTYARFFLRRSPKLRATLLDRGSILSLVRELELNRAVEKRLDYRPGDFVKGSLGRGYDLVWASNVLHTLDPDGARIFIGRCRRALRPGGRLLVHDFFLAPGGTRPRRAAVFSVHMLAVTPAGRSYRLDDALRLLREAGFRDPRLLGRVDDSAILEATRP